MVEDAGKGWVLRIFSPQLSRAMRRALANGDFVEQRRLSYYALNNKFPDKWAALLHAGYEVRGHGMAGDLMNMGEDLFQGVTMYLYDFVTEGKCITDNPDDAIGIWRSEEHQFDAFGSGTGVEDEGYPVDIKLWAENQNVADGSDFYPEGVDFIGYYAGSETWRGGSGFITGRLKGYGYLEMSEKMDGFSLVPGFGGGIVVGTYVGRHEYPDNFPSGATPATFVGSGRSWTVGPIERWVSYNLVDGDEQITWKGESLEIAGFDLTDAAPIAAGGAGIFKRILSNYGVDWAADILSLGGGTHETETKMMSDFVHQGGVSNTFYDCDQ